MCDTIQVKNWTELTTFVEETNTDEFNVVLCGWIKDYKKNKSRTKRLYFRRVPIKN